MTLVAVVGAFGVGVLFGLLAFGLALLEGMEATERKRPRDPRGRDDG